MSCITEFTEVYIISNMYIYAKINQNNPSIITPQKKSYMTIKCFIMSGIAAHVYILF